MMWTILFWISLVFLAETYLLFPAFIFLVSRKKKNNALTYCESEDLPIISILVSVYNEEDSIEKRIHNLFISNYPSAKTEVWIGSDGSTDQTVALIKNLQHQYPTLKYKQFNSRRGKGNVLNDLKNLATGELLLFTDSKVQFSPQTLFQLVKHFKNPKIAIVGGHLVNKTYQPDGISIQENRYLTSEIMIKFNEGVAWGTSMGVYGACFAMRAQLYKPVPVDFAVEDFFQTLQVLTEGHQAVMELNALCYENVPNQINEEFRRKVRISTGNFQNLMHFRRVLLRFDKLAFCFFSHKVIRWTGPFFLLSLFISNLAVSEASTFYLITFFTQLLFLILPIIDFFLHKIHIHIIILRFVTHFYSMNLALLTGFVKYMKGINTNVWEPTTRKYV